MQLCDLRTLGRAAAKGAFLPSCDADDGGHAFRLLLRAARDVAAGVAHAHREGLVHGDLGPDAVLLAVCGLESGGSGWWGTAAAAAAANSHTPNPSL